MTNNFKVKGIVLAMGMTFASTPVFAADEDAVDDDAQTMVIVGSRAAPRSIGDSPVPIDVIGADELQSNGASDMSTLLRTASPSYNVNDQGISDGATIVRPANLRGLSPDSTLVLVNGKRRHKGSIIAFSGGGVADGAQSPDVSTIPAMALKQVEVLRDGASAQYGSDAIAGVINFVLKDNSSGGNLAIKAGRFSEGDGDLLTISANMGFALTERGFVSLTVETSTQDPTSRSIQRADAQGLIDAGNTEVRTPAAQVWGTPELSNDFKLFLNSGIDLDNNAEAYLFGNWAQKTVEGGFFFRNPTNRSGIYNGPTIDGEFYTVGGSIFDVGDPVDTILVGDLTPGATDNSACPIVRLSADGIPDQGALASLAGANCFAHNVNIPGGFTPSFGGDVVDLSLVMGTRGEFSGGTTYDFSGSVGEHSTEFFINNTLNSSLGPDSPRDFSPGGYTQLEQAFNADFSKDFDNWIMSYGAEIRRTQFTILAGDLASFSQGPLVPQGFSIGSNGFPGFKPADAGSSSRTSKAVYIDAEYDVTEDFLAQGAARFEDFSDFGSTFDWKVAGLYTVSDNLKVRASVSTGFRAPTIGQANVRTVQTQTDANGILQDVATLPPTNPVSARFGGVALQPEESFSYAAGFVYENGDFFLTADYFNVEVTDRITQTSEINLTDTDRAELTALGVTDAIGLTSVKYFSNDFDTTTKGLDLVANYSNEAFGGDISYSLAFAWVDTTVDRSGPNTDSRKIGRLEEGLPKTKGSFTTKYQADDWSLMGRINHFGAFEQFGPNISGPAALLFDTEFGYDISDSMGFAFGINNISDERGPDAAVNSVGLSTSSGRAFSTVTPYGSNGRFYYVNLAYSFD